MYFQRRNRSSRCQIIRESPKHHSDNHILRRHNQSSTSSASPRHSNHPTRPTIPTRPSLNGYIAQFQTSGSSTQTGGNQRRAQPSRPFPPPPPPVPTPPQPPRYNGPSYARSSRTMSSRARQSDASSHPPSGSGFLYWGKPDDKGRQELRMRGG